MDLKMERILSKVQKPGRYVGGESGAIKKDKAKMAVRFAFCFPDTYEIGMSHLGMKILYSLLNNEPDIWCERVFAPWTDMEAEMRSNQVPLFALESGDNMQQFDFLGFTLQYELSYTNVLNMLDLGEVPLLAKDRTENDPIVLAGGPCTCNPEPMADFIDLFVIGEGEEVTLELTNLYKQMKNEGKSRDAYIKAAAKIKGVYAPALYEVTYQDDGTIQAVTPIADAPAVIEKRIILDMNQVFFPHDFVVPSIEIVHDRAVAEVQRGCYRGCRFCQAGYIYRPVREKSVAVVNKQCHDLCTQTGYDEVSLSSLSTSDYTNINELLDTMNTWTNDEKVSISLPSLRVDGFSTELMDKIKTVRRSGLTFAPEAGTQRLRNVINKNVAEAELMKTVRTAFDGGWSTIKLYFMIGLPTETLEDVAGIAELAQKVVEVYYTNPNRPKGKGLKVTCSASSFVPKPFTPFQWMAQDTIETLHQKQKHLVNAIQTKKITCNYHEADTSFLEGVFSRGDRRLGAVLLEAYKQGCKFDGWSEYFSLKKWLSVFESCNIDPTFYNQRARSFTEVLPWDHLDYGVHKDFLIEECKLAYQDETSPNCAEKCLNCGVASYKGGICIEKR